MPPLDLDKLPVFAQCELQDFYQFLLQKYSAEIGPKASGQLFSEPRLVKPFVPLARDAIYDR